MCIQQGNKKLFSLYEIFRNARERYLSIVEIYRLLILLGENSFNSKPTIAKPLL